MGSFLRRWVKRVNDTTTCKQKTNVFRSRKKFMQSFRFFTNLSMKISNFSKTLLTIFMNFCTRSTAKAMRRLVKKSMINPTKILDTRSNWHSLIVVHNDTAFKKHKNYTKMIVLKNFISLFTENQY